MQFNPKILKTSTFRLAAIYLLVFALSVGSILAYVFWNTAGLLERQTDATIRAEVQALADQYRLLGLRGIVQTVQRRSAERGGGVYLIADSEGKRIAGNLESVPPQVIDETGWIDFPLDIQIGTNKQRRSARAFHTDLKDDYELIVGRDVQELRHFGDIIRRTLVLGPGHCPGSGPRWRPAHQPQLPAPGGCHHRRQPRHHGRRSFKPHAGSGNRR